MNIKQGSRIRSVAAASALLALTAFVSRFAFSAEAGVIRPYSISVKTGRTVGSGINALAAGDNNLITFIPARRGFSGTFLFKLSNGIDPSDITSLALQTVFRGPELAIQRWYWQILNINSKSWVTLGDNAFASQNKSVALEFQVGGDLRRFVDSGRTLTVRYTTSNQTSSSALDYLALEVDSSGGVIDPAPTSSSLHPTPGVSWQMQLTGKVDTSVAADLYDIDLFDVPATTISELKGQGRTVVCYFSAGSWENWRPDADTFPEAVKGRSNGWAGEKWLDVANLQALRPIMEARMDLAVAKGCDGVDPDNVDGYSNNTGFPITSAQQLAYNRFLAASAHSRGLIVALKNDLDQVEDLVDHFDFAVNEECFQYSECDLLLSFVRRNKAVLGIEYSGDASRFCPNANASNFDFQKKNLDLDAWRQVCRGWSL